MTVLIVVVLVVLVIAYYGIKKKYQQAHPKKCDFCGKMVPGPTRLKDGHVCGECLKIPYGDGVLDFAPYIREVHPQKTGVMELRTYFADLSNRGDLMKGFNPTRISPSGCVEVDDNLGLYIIKRNDEVSFAHRVRDISGFKLVMDKNWDSDSSETVYVNGGHISIHTNELVKELIINISVDLKLVGMRHHVKQVFEGDLKFLEDLTGLKRS